MCWQHKKPGHQQLWYWLEHSSLSNRRVKASQSTQQSVHHYVYHWIFVDPMHPYKHNILYCLFSVDYEGALAVLTEMSYLAQETGGMDSTHRLWKCSLCCNAVVICETSARYLYLLMSKVLTNEKRLCMCNVFSHWPRLCSVVDWKQALISYVMHG